jgi:hydroxyethylthiazole kinase
MAGLRGRLEANPTNLIRVMPAEGEEMQLPDTAVHEGVAEAAAALVARLRARSPRVHCITNAVAQNFTANLLLAAGCVPSMTLDPDEIASFVGNADALLVNLGTFDAERRAATEIAVATAAREGVPWVLDPVFVDRSASRAGFARGLIARSPSVVRLNHAEFAALVGAEPSPEAASAAARANGVVIGLSGATDLVTDGERTAIIANGDPLMAKVTAMGCAASALIAACLGVEPDAWRAAAAALTLIGVAGELAAANADGPGTFAVAILDALYRLDRASLIAHAKVT